MRYFLANMLLGSFLVLSCQSFAQSGPSLAVDGKIISFDPKYVTPATESTRQEVVGQAQEIVDQALLKGLRTLGTIDLQRLREELSTVNVVTVRPGASAIGAGKFTVRLGSVYFVETRTVYLNGDTLFNNSRAKPLMIHEFLGALKYDDENYQISSILLSKQPNILAKRLSVKSTDFGNKLTKTPAKKIVNYNGDAISSGGTTVIGGGGDDILLSAKVYMIDHFDAWREKVLPVLLQDESVKTALAERRLDVRKFQDKVTQEAYFKYFLQTPFEPLTDKDNVPGKPISNLNEIDLIFGVFENKESSFYVRLSRNHWDWSIGNLSVEQSRFVTAGTIHFHLLMSYLTMKDQ